MQPKTSDFCDERLLWRLTNQISDYFRHMGGAGRYAGFSEWHPDALLLLLISGVDPSEKGFLDRPESFLISPRIWRETDGLPEATFIELQGNKVTHLQFERHLKHMFNHLGNAIGAAELIEWAAFLASNRHRFTQFTGQSKTASSTDTYLVW